MTFESRITRAPTAYDRDRANDVMAGFGELPPRTTEVLHGAAGCSPYLAGLMAKERDWIVQALDNPEEALAFETVDVLLLDRQDLSAGLRRAKRRVALLVGLADLGGVWGLEKVTKALSEFADASVNTCLSQFTWHEFNRGKIPGMTVEDAETNGGLFALAMGKGGALELNYSSDIDLIVLFDGDRYDRSSYDDARAAFIRVTRKMATTLSDVTDQGYVFRTDLRLRPDASVTPVCLSTDAAEHYYESVGRTWERAAYIKARAAAGDQAAGERFLETLSPFVWRRHLDFASIQDAHDMRLKIRDHKGLHGKLNLDGHNIKLGRGGIREIEFFTQTRQLIAGGRDPNLRVRDTKTGLERLAAADWVPTDDARILYDHYSFHREVEHRLQMVSDQQTHSLPTAPDAWERLACFMGRSVDDLRRELTDRSEEVHTLTEGFFAPDAAAPAQVDGFGAEFEARWRGYPALRSERAVEIFKRLKPEIFARLKEAAKPEEALLQFDGFLRGLPAGVQLFSLFDANPQLTKMIVDICATAPALAQYLSRNAAVFDMVIGGDFFAPWPGTAKLTEMLTAELHRAADYEDALNAARRFMKEWHFRVGVHHLQGLISGTESGEQYSDLASAVIAGLWPVVVDEFARKHGPMPGAGAVVLGMGSLGAARLNAGSDLDLIMIYDPQDATESDGRRPLAVRAYYARLTQALITAVTAPMSDGQLYEVDMRLRPSGRQGPVATSLTSFDTYQRTEAWTWEHLALTRARPIAGSPELADRVETLRQEILREKAGGETILADVADMRRRLAAAKAPSGVWDAKNGAGRLMDVELCAQTAALRAGASVRGVVDQIGSGVASGWFDAADKAALCRSADLFWSLQAAARLLTGGTLDPQALGEGGIRFILRETGFDDVASLTQEMERVAAEANTVISQLLGEVEHG